MLSPEAAGADAVLLLSPEALLLSLDPDSDFPPDFPDSDLPESDFPDSDLPDSDDLPVSGDDFFA